MHVNVINLCISQGSSEKQQRYRYIEIYIISLPSTNWRSRKARLSSKVWEPEEPMEWSEWKHQRWDGSVQAVRQENRENSSFLSLLVYSDFQWVRWWSLTLERAAYFSESSNSDVNLHQKHCHRHTHKSYLIWAPPSESRWPIKFTTIAWAPLSIVITDCMMFLSPNTCWFLEIKS